MFVIAILSRIFSIFKMILNVTLLFILAEKLIDIQLKNEINDVKIYINQLHIIDVRFIISRYRACRRFVF